MITLENKLFQYEEYDGRNPIFKFYLAEDIVKMCRKIQEKGLLLTLTPHERKLADNAKRYYYSNKESMCNKVC